MRNEKMSFRSSCKVKSPMPSFFIDKLIVNKHETEHFHVLLFSLGCIKTAKKSEVKNIM